MKAPMAWSSSARLSSGVGRRCPGTMRPGSSGKEFGRGQGHMPTLGNQRDNRGGYAEIASISAHEARDRYRDTLSDKAAAASVHELAEMTKTQRVVVFCFEENEQHCHREQVIEQVTALLGRELVVHS